MSEGGTALADARSSTEFLGRDALVERVVALVASQARLVTLRGIAGVGKARLAAAVGERLTREGRIALARTVSLRGVTDASAARRALDAAMEDLTRAKRAVCLVLEGCEGARSEIVLWLEAQLPMHPRLLVLATSRARLGTPAEHVVAVEPLAHDDAVALFLSRSAATRGEAVGSEADPERERAARALVRELGALPLAVELAAAQTSALSIAELMARSDAALDLLASPHPTPRAHEASLRAAMEAAIRGFDPELARVTEICACFESRFLLSDVEALAAAPAQVARALVRLVDASMLTVEPHAEGNAYALHRPLRVLARGSSASGPGDATLQRAYVAHVLSAVQPLADASHVSHARSRLERFRDDLVAMTLQREFDESQSVTAALALATLARSRGPVPAALEAIDRVAKRSSAQDALLVRLLHARGVLHGRAGNGAAAQADLLSAVELAERLGETTLAARAQIDRCDLLRHAGEFDTAAEGYRRALELFRHDADVEGEAHALGALAGVAHERGDLDAAVGLYDQAERGIGQLAARGQDVSALAPIWHNRGVLLAERGQTDEAEIVMQRALVGHRDAGNLRFEGIAEYDLGSVALGRRDVARARAHLRRAELLAREAGDVREVGLSEALLGVCDAWLGATSSAEARFASASVWLHRAAEPAPLAALAAHSAHLALAELRTRRQRGLPPIAVLESEVRAASKRAEAQAAAGDEVRFARQLLESEMARVLVADRVVVARDGSWVFSPEQGRVSLARRATLRRVLITLVSAHASRPGTVLEAEELVRAGWPATRSMTPDAKNRLHVALAALRKLGLGESLAREPGGYALVDIEIGERAQSEA